MHPNPNRDGLSTTTLAVFFVIGVAMFVLAARDFKGEILFLLVGAVMAASNGVALYRRRPSRRA